MSSRNSVQPLVLLLFSATLICLASTSLEAQTSAAPVEMVTGSAHPFDSAAERATVLGLLERARQNISLHGPGSTPFVMHLTFSAAGAVEYTGQGELDETYVAMGRNRWSARLGSYWQDRLFLDNGMFDQRAGSVPLRVQMVRGAVFNPMPGNWQHRAIRLAGAIWQGKDLMCVLLGGNNSTPDHGTRRWDETEFCVDKATGLLQTYSPASGLYAVYSYQNAFQINDRTFPSDVVFAANGEPVLQIHIESLRPPTQQDLKALELTPDFPAVQSTGPLLLGAPLKLVFGAHAPAGAAQKVESVIVHASIDTAGRVLEAEPLCPSKQTDTQAALKAVRGADLSSYPGIGDNYQREAFLYVKFVPGNSSAGQ